MNNKSILKQLLKIAENQQKILTKLASKPEKTPDDYESCAECGFDHSYEYKEALETHNELSKETKLVEEFIEAAKLKYWKKAGQLVALIDKENGQYVDSVEAIRTIKYFKDPDASRIVIPLDGWVDFTEGYCDGANKSPSETERDLELTLGVLNKIKNK